MLLLATGATGAAGIVSNLVIQFFFSLKSFNSYLLPGRQQQGQEQGQEQGQLEPQLELRELSGVGRDGAGEVVVVQEYPSPKVHQDGGKDGVFVGKIEDMEQAFPIQ